MAKKAKGGKKKAGKKGAKKAGGPASQHYSYRRRISEGRITPDDPRPPKSGK